MLVVPTGISESVDEIENIEKTSDTYGRCRVRAFSNIILEDVGERNIILANRWIFWAESLTFRVEQTENWTSLVIKTLPDDTPYFYEGEVRVTITSSSPFLGFFGCLDLNDGIFFYGGKGIAFALEVEEI
jgi:hypothetical protein